jgi:hypothetical protein
MIGGAKMKLSLGKIFTHPEVILTEVGTTCVLTDTDGNVLAFNLEVQISSSPLRGKWKIDKDSISFEAIIKEKTWVRAKGLNTVLNPEDTLTVHLLDFN